MAQGYVVSGAAAIAAYLYRDTSVSVQRRVRRLISTGVIPAKTIGGRLESHTDWLDAVYARPDRVAPPEPTPQDLGPCAVPRCRERVLSNGKGGAGRPPKYCEAHRDRKARSLK